MPLQTHVPAHTCVSHIHTQSTAFSIIVIHFILIYSIVVLFGSIPIKADAPVLKLLPVIKNISKL